MYGKSLLVVKLTEYLTNLNNFITKQATKKAQPYDKVVLNF